MSVGALSFKLNRLRDKIRYGLFWEYIQSRFAKIGFEIVPFYVLQEGVGLGQLTVNKPALEGYICEFFDENDMAEIASLRADGPNIGEFQNRLKDGNKCFGIRYEGRIIAFNWIHFHFIQSGVYRQELKKDEVYLFDMYTGKEFRGKNIAPYLRYQTYRVLSGEGKNTFYSISLSFNTASIRFKKKLNSKFIKFGIFIHLFKKYTRSWIIKKYA